MKKKNKKNMKKTFQSIGKFIEKNIKIVVPCVIVFVGLIIAIILLVCSGEKTNQKELEETLRDMGAVFYEDYYYGFAVINEADKEANLAPFKKAGIVVNINNLGSYNGNKNKEKIETFVNSKTQEKCDLEESKVIIYPKEPYGLKDYDIEVQLVCGFGTLKELQLEAKQKGLQDYEKMSLEELKEALKK